MQKQSFGTPERLVNIHQAPEGVYAMKGATHVALGAGQMAREIEIRNAGGSTVYVWIFDAAAKPDDGATWNADGGPSSPIPVLPLVSGGLPVYRALFRPVAKGLVIAASSDPDTFTYASSASLEVVVTYGR